MQHTGTQHTLDQYTISDARAAEIIIGKLRRAGGEVLIKGCGYEYKREKVAEFFGLPKEQCDRVLKDIGIQKGGKRLVWMSTWFDRNKRTYWHVGDPEDEIAVHLRLTKSCKKILTVEVGA